MTPRQIACDLHIHSCLSPCGDEDMTVNNIVNMAVLKGLDLIAVTDHNSSKNCPALLEAAQGKPITVLPGMELCTSEEIHVVCLFGELGAAMDFDAFVHDRLPPVPNKPEVFGRQVILNALDEEAGQEELLLLTAADISVEEVTPLVRSYGGVCFPAHIDRDSFSILSSLGTIPESCGFTAVEVRDPSAFFADRDNRRYSKGRRVLTNSDAHVLWDISEREHFLPLEEPGFAALARWILNP